MIALGGLPCSPASAHAFNHVNPPLGSGPPGRIRPQTLEVKGTGRDITTDCIA